MSSSWRLKASLAFSRVGSAILFFRAASERRGPREVLIDEKSSPRVSSGLGPAPLLFRVSPAGGFRKGQPLPRPHSPHLDRRPGNDYDRLLAKRSLLEERRSQVRREGREGS